jgi:hypothetical protein
MCVFLIGCSSAVATSTSQVSYASAQADWSQFPDYEQCLVGVQIFYPARFGASVPIAGEFWSGDCAPEGACHVWYDATPDPGTWERIPNDGSESPSTYDMIVFGPTSTNPYGHIASVDHVEGGDVYVMDDNYNGDERRAWQPHTVSRGALGWYHLRSLPKDGGGSGGGGSGYCPNNGLYCGGDYIQGDPNTLYRCSGHELYVEQTCDSGCQWNPAGVDDACQSAPPPPVSQWCPNDGLYCGGDYIQGDPATLYQCSGHVLSVYEACGGACVVQPNGYDDYCE